MWQKLTDIEKRDIEEKEMAHFKKTRLKKSLLVFSIVFILFMSLQVIGALTYGINEHRTRLDPISRSKSPIEWSELPIYLPRFIFKASILGLIVFFVFYRLGNSKNKSGTLICDKCFKTINYRNNFICECGGNLDLLTNYKWIEESNEVKTD